MRITTATRNVAIALLVISAAAWAATDPLMGTWKLNVDKSTYSPGPAPKSSMNTYGPYGKDGFSYDATQVNAQGQTQHVTFVAEYDGKEYPITGDPARDTIIAERVDLYTTRTTSKKDGKVTNISTRVVSKDRKTITLTTKGTNTQGQPVSNIAIYERQ